MGEKNISKARDNVVSVSLVLVIALALVIIAAPAMAAPSAGSVTRSLPATAAPGATITVTLTPSSMETAPGWGVTETLPAGWTFVSTTADGHSVVAGAHRFVNFSAPNTFIAYTVTAPAASGTYTFSGTFVDGNLVTGTVSPAVGSVTVGTGGPGEFSIDSYLPPGGTPAVWKAGVLRAFDDYFGGILVPPMTKPQVLSVFDAYFA